ncbi:DUF4229 domain-containing protein [Gordonia sp. (in: high G+C Gram-positive bacteria)]|uniref:DUF4229 domain-containing protein n=1 Tax=Gordonia sp. (in: high G+C Gram-positive bacteria) TaxID=84139 RepID=UPI003C74042C
MTDQRPAEEPTDQQAPATAKTLILAVVLYSLARIALVVAIALAIFGLGILIGVKVPPLVAAVFGVLIAIPLGMVLFKTLRINVNDQIAQVDARRAAQRDDLQSRLRGE